MNTAELADWVAKEQAILWHDLDNALRQAINGAWSIEASNIARRIVGAARMVGPTPTDSVPYSFVAGGVYEAILTAGDVPAYLPDADEFDRLDTLMAKHGTTRASAQPQYARTLAEIRSQRESRWISGGE